LPGTTLPDSMIDSLKQTYANQNGLLTKPDNRSAGSARLSHREPWCSAPITYRAGQTETKPFILPSFSSPTEICEALSIPCRRTAAFA
jgi:hypothetical protein